MSPDRRPDRIKEVASSLWKGRVGLRVDQDKEGVALRGSCLMGRDISPIFGSWGIASERKSLLSIFTCTPVETKPTPRPRANGHGGWWPWCPFLEGIGRLLGTPGHSMPAVAGLGLSTGYP